MILPKHYFRNGIIFTISVVLLMVLIIGLIAHVSLRDLLIMVLMVIGMGAVIGGLMGWLFFKFIYPQLGIVSQKLAVDTNMPVNLSKEMNVEYELNIDDVLAFHLYHRWHSPQLGWFWKLTRYSLLFVAAIEIIFAIVLIIAFGEDMLPFSVALGILAILTFLYSILSPFMSRKTLRWALTRDYSQGRNKLIGKHKLSITPDAVTDITDMGESMTRWNARGYVKSTDRYLFMLDRASSPYIVPKRTFLDEAAFKQFVEVAKSYHQVAIAQQKA
jgi:hypothetical protein